MSAPLTPAEEALARVVRRRAVALDVAGIALAVLGAAAIMTVLVLLLGGLAAGLLGGGTFGLAAGIAIMRREYSVPDLLAPRELPVPRGPDEDTAPGQPYAPARGIDDGAPRSPITGM